MPLMMLLISDSIVSSAQAELSGLRPGSLRLGFVGHSCTPRLMMVSYQGDAMRTFVPGDEI
jgi:hypothetical protein